MGIYHRPSDENFSSAKHDIQFQVGDNLPKKKYLTGRLALKKLIKKEYCRCGPHPLQAISSRARPPLVKGAGCIGPLSRNSGVGHSGSWPPLH